MHSRLTRSGVDVAQCCSIVKLQEVTSRKITPGTLLIKGPETMTVGEWAVFFCFGLFINRRDSYDVLLAGVYTVLLAYGISLSGGDSQAHCTHSNSPGAV